MTTSELRCEATKSRLVIEQTASKDYTTPGAMRRMMADAAHEFRPDFVKYFEKGAPALHRRVQAGEKIK
jgi:hypothetical protein